MAPEPALSVSAPRSSSKSLSWTTRSNAKQCDSFPLFAWHTGSARVAMVHVYVWFFQRKNAKRYGDKNAFPRSSVCVSDEGQHHAQTYSADNKMKRKENWNHWEQSAVVNAGAVRILSCRGVEFFIIQDIPRGNYRIDRSHFSPLPQN